MNDSDTNAVAIQRLVSMPTSLQLTNPTNLVSGSINSYDSANPDERIDYIMPCSLLASNIVNGQIFRTDLLNPLPSGLMRNDDTEASDHLPVLMTFADPFDAPFRLLSLTRTNQNVTLKWESATNRVFSVETSANLVQWTTLASNLFSTGTNFIFTTDAAADEAARAPEAAALAAPALEAGLEAALAAEELDAAAEAAAEAAFDAAWAGAGAELRADALEGAPEAGPEAALADRAADAGADVGADTGAGMGPDMGAEAGAATAAGGGAGAATSCARSRWWMRVGARIFRICTGSALVNT